VSLRVSLASPFALGDLVARLAMDGAPDVYLVLREGLFDAPLPARPTWFTLTSRAPSEGMLRSATPSAASQPSLKGASARQPVEISALYEHGIAVPDNGCLDLDLLWLAPCDASPISTGEGTRFGSFEHTMCARLVGKAADGKTELALAGIRASFSDETTFAVGGKDLSFGEIIALAGDFYAHLDDAAREQFGWAWPAPPEGLIGWLMADYRANTLVGDDARSVAVIREHILAEGSPAGFFHSIASLIDDAVGRYPTRRYLALASQNGCHFACQPAGYADTGNEALVLYRAYHRRALREAAVAGRKEDREAFRTALVADAFGCHFLTDLFASGHIRVPRRVLGERFGIARGALMMAKKMHDEDNRIGLWCTARAPGAPGKTVVWRAYGDGSLAIPEASDHRARVREAVRVSAAEVFAAFAAAQADIVSPNIGRAEDLVPVPMPPGEVPSSGYVLPNGDDAPSVAPNHYPLYALLADGRIAERVGATDRNEYVPLEAEASALARA
jgi:hypothetical protein